MATDTITLARPYAKAAFEYALENKQLADWSGFLQVVAMITREPRVASMLHNPHVSTEDLESLYKDIAKQWMKNEGQSNFIQLLAANKRLSATPDICSLYQRLVSDYEQTMDVVVTCFKPLTDTQKIAMAERLELRFKRKVKLDCQIDESILGGAKIRAGDVVIDGTVRGKLEELSKYLV